MPSNLPERRPWYRVMLDTYGYITDSGEIAKGVLQELGVWKVLIALVVFVGQGAWGILSSFPGPLVFAVAVWTLAGMLLLLDLAETLAKRVSLRVRFSARTFSAMLYDPPERFAEELGGDEAWLGVYLFGVRITNPTRRRMNLEFALEVPHQEPSAAVGLGPEVIEQRYRYFPHIEETSLVGPVTVPPEGSIPNASDDPDDLWFMVSPFTLKLTHGGDGLRFSEAVRQCPARC